MELIYLALVADALPAILAQRKDFQISMLLHVCNLLSVLSAYIFSRKLVYIFIHICTMYNQWFPSSKDSTLMITKSQRQQRTNTKGLTVRHCNFVNVQIQSACQCIMTQPPKILWPRPTALLNTWTIITFPK